MPAAQTQTAARVDPYRAYNFKLEIQGVQQGHFTECSGLGIKIHPIKYREGGEHQIIHAIPGPVEYADITLRYGLTDSQELWTWLKNTMDGKVERKEVSIVLLDNEGANEAMRWNLGNAWVSEWRGAILNAMNREVAIESMTLVFESIERVQK
jgi:phage tail-like protein